jgi:hypothetical protein
MPQVGDKESLKDFMHANSDLQQAVLGDCTTPVLGAIHVVDLSWCGQSLCSYAQLANHPLVHETFCHTAVK